MLLNVAFLSDQTSIFTCCIVPQPNRVSEGGTWAMFRSAKYCTNHPEQQNNITKNT